MRSTRFWTLCAVVLSMAFGGLWLRNGESSVDERIGFNPTTWFPAAWEDALGGDAPSPESVGVDISTVANLTDVPERDRLMVSRLTTDIAYAAASGSGHALYGTYFARNHPVVGGPPTPPSGAQTVYCSDVKIAATSSFVLPTSPAGSFIKSLVLWSGTCPFPPPAIAQYSDAPLYVSFVYLARSDAYPHEVPQNLLNTYNGWVPIRPIEIPGASSWYRPTPTPPASWELAEIESCALDKIAVRTEVAAAYAGLCAEARSQGVRLLAIDGLRDPAQQRERFEAAVREFGSERAARVRVAFSDGNICESSHCAGEALDVSPGDEVATWLKAVVGCLDASGSYRSPPCTDSDQPVSRIERYGFSITNPTYPFHLEYVIGTLATDAGLYGDCTPGALDIRTRIQLVFHCRVMEAGLDRDEALIAATSAVAIAECSSGLNPAFVSFDGRFRTTPNPSTGHLDDRSGLFALSSAVAERWAGSNASLRLPLTNIDTAARVYVEERAWGRWGWDPFACAAADDGTVRTSVFSQ